MSNLPSQHVAIVGVGLIGGSLGLALRRRGGYEVWGVCRSAESARRVLATGAVDRALESLPEAAAWADVIVFCTPVVEIARRMREALPHLRPGAVMSDAGSTKARLVAEIEAELEAELEQSGQRCEFVGAHPLAGDHRRGPDAAREDLFRGRNVILTPTPKSSPVALAVVERLWQATGAKTKRMSPADHDEALARTSHLPHLVAAALAGSTPRDLLELAATGWTDTTRIAAGDPSLWRDIYLANREPTLAALVALEARLAEFRSAIISGDSATLEQLLQQGKDRRDAVGS